MAQTSRQLGDILVDEGHVTQEQLDFASEQEAKTGTPTWRVLLEHGLVGQRDLLRARAAQIGMDFVDVAATAPSPEALALVPEELARRQLVLPIAVHADVLLLAMADPRNQVAVEEVERITGRRVAPAAAYGQDLVDAIPRAYGPPPGSGSEVPAPTAPSSVHAPPPPAPGAPAISAASAYSSPAAPGVSPPAEAPATAQGPGAASDAGTASGAVETGQVEDKEPNLAEFLISLIEGDGSDLHLTAGLPPMVRIYGELSPIKGYRKLTPQDLQEIVFSMLTQKQREKFEEEHELDVSYSLPGKARFRVNVFRQRDALGSVMRLIPFGIKPLDELGIPPSVKEFARLKRGMVLVTGITGSGKSTTLAGLIDLVNSQRHDHIMTVEDPIEFLHQHKKSVVNQREVGSDTHSFAGALKHVLRQDPDVILVGELRDLETISTALTAAETGHLVFATLHTQDAPQSVDRIIDVFPPHQQEQIRIMLAGSLAGVVSQQLVPRADGKGRAAAVEVLVTTPAIKNLIREGKTHQIYTALQAGGQYGMQVMDQHLAELVKKGTITYEAALERCHRVEEFNRLAGKG